jgi:8-oxo-dGTP diphosphatase
MDVPTHREIACAILIDPQGRFLLQRRDDVPNILYPGKIGLFGGHREGSESYLECVVREVHEETSYLAPPERFEHLWSYAGPDYAVDGGMLSGEYYILRDVPVDAIKVTEGSLFIAERKDFPSLAEECSPSVTASLEQFFDRVDRATLVGLSMLYQTLRSVSDNHVHVNLEVYDDAPTRAVRR